MQPRNKTYHGKHHQGIIVAKGLDEPEPDKASQTDRYERDAQENSSHDEDRDAATLQR